MGVWRRGAAFPAGGLPHSLVALAIHLHRRERGRLRRQDRFYRRAICDLALPCAVPIVAHSTLESLAWLVARSVREDEIQHAPPALRDGMTDACAF